mgnify:FL=1|jgi:multiple sugar transport system permease protein
MVKHKKKSLFRKYNIPVFLLLLLIALLMVFPFVWMFLSAFKTQAEVYAYPPQWLPNSFHLNNFRKVFEMVPFGRFYYNTIVTTVAQTALQMILSITAAYAFAKLDFPAKRALYMFMQSAMFVPMAVSVIPLYLMVAKLGLVNTYLGLILPQILGVFTTVLLMSFFKSIPDDLLDAAKIDGCGYYSILWQVIIPNSKNAISAATLFAFLSHWKSYLWPLLVTNNTNMRTLPIGMKYLITEASNDYHLMMAAALMSILPVLLVYVISEENFVKSITLSGVKG